MNCERYQAWMEGSSTEIFEQICFVILDICQKNQALAFDGTRDEGMEKLFGLTQPVFASIQHTCSGGLEQSAHAATLFMKVAFVHGAAPWMRNFDDGTTLDVNLRISVFSQQLGSDHNRITVELASDQASSVMFISTCGDIYKNLLAKNDATEFDSVDLINISADGVSFPLFRFCSERSQLDSWRLSKKNASNVHVVAFAGANDCCSGTRLINEAFHTCRHALQHILNQSKFQDVAGGFLALQRFCDSFVHDDCAEHRISSSTSDVSFMRLKSTVQLPLSASFYTRSLVTFTQLASYWIAAKISSRAYLSDSKLSLESMPHPASLDALVKSLSEHTSIYSGTKKASGILLNVLVETSNKRQIDQKSDMRASSHTMIRRKSVGGMTSGQLPLRGASSAFDIDQQKKMSKRRSSISAVSNVDFIDVRQSIAKEFQKQFITSQASTSIELTSGLTSSRAPKLRILKEQKCSLSQFAQGSASDQQEMSSAVISCSQKFIIMTVGTNLHFIDIIMGKKLLTNSIFIKDMSANLRILCCCEELANIFLVLSDGRLICFKYSSHESGMTYECTEFETCIDQCSVCSIFVHREWLNICGSEGSQNVDYVRFKLEACNVVGNSGHVLPLTLSSSATAMQFHLFDPKVLCPFVLCGLCNSDIEICGKFADEDLHTIQILRNRTLGLGAINSICSMGKDTIAVGHEGGYIHIWSIDISSNSSSYLDRQFGLSPSSKGLPRSFQNVSNDKFSEDKHHTDSQLFVINEQYGDSVIMHSETGVTLHTFSLPLFPPHILHQFSGQSNNFVTVFELSVLCMEGSSLRHWHFQLQYLSGDKSASFKKIAAFAEQKRRISPDYISIFNQQNASEANVDHVENVSTLSPIFRDDDGCIQKSEPLCNSSKVSRTPNAGQNRLLSDVSSTQNDCSTNLSTSSCQQSSSELEQVSSMHQKASGIMTQILSRRSFPDVQYKITSKISPETADTGEIRTENDLVWKILRPQNHLTANFDFDGDTLQVLEAKQIHDDSAEKMSRPQNHLTANFDCDRSALEADFKKHLEISRNHEQHRVPPRLLQINSEENVDHGTQRANNFSRSSLSRFQSPRTPLGSNLLKTIPLKLHDHTGVRRHPTASNQHERINTTGSDLRSSWAMYHEKGVQQTSEIQRDNLESRTLYPSLRNFDPFTFNLTSREGLLSLAEPSSKHNEHDLDSESDISSSRFHSLLRLDHQSSNIGSNELHAYSRSSRHCGRLPKKLQ